jgi:metal-dependent HD superfamily phosphatase/phosphodiesterase
MQKERERGGDPSAEYPFLEEFLAHWLEHTKRPEISEKTVVDPHESGSTSERFSLILAAPKLRELLNGIYDVGARTAMLAEVLHAIITHRSDGRPLTLEAGVVRVADALDMAKGRSRIAFEAGQVNIHSLSAAAIDHIEIQQGELKPVRIAVEMLNSAGVFQLDQL